MGGHDTPARLFVLKNLDEEPRFVMAIIHV